MRRSRPMAMVLVLALVSLLLGPLTGGGEAAAIPADVQGHWAEDETARIILDWRPVTGADAYAVYRNGSLARQLPAATTEWTDVNVDFNTTYFYHVVAIAGGVPSAQATGRFAVAPDCFRWKDLEQTIMNQYQIIANAPVPPNQVLEEQDWWNGIRRFIAVGLSPEGVQRYNEYYAWARDYRDDALEMLQMARRALLDGRFEDASRSLETAVTFWRISQEYDSAALKAYHGALAEAQEIEYRTAKLLASTGGILGKAAGDPLVSGLAMAVGAWADASFRDPTTALTNLLVDQGIKLAAIPFSAGVVEGLVSTAAGDFLEHYGTLAYSGGKWVLNTDKLIDAFGSYGAADAALRDWVWAELDAARARGELPLESEVLRSMMQDFRISLAAVAAQADAGAVAGGVVLGQGPAVGAGSAPPTDTLDSGTESTPPPTPAATPAARLAAGGDYSLTLKADGTVWAWGDNEYGSLGNGTTEDRSTPVPVSGLTGVVAVATGPYHSLALKADGSVWSWGSGGRVGLGDGTTDGRLTPVRVLLP